MAEFLDRIYYTISGFANNATGVYENFDLSQGLTSFTAVIVALFAGAIIACFAVLYTKTVLGGIVKRLVDAGATTEEGAKTLAELKLHSVFSRAALKVGKPLRKSICAIGGEIQPKKKGGDIKTDFAVAKFYIPEESLDAVKRRYRRRGTDPLTLILAIVFLTAACLLALAWAPDLLQMLDNLISILKG